MSEPVIVIRGDREAMFAKRHPWVFSGAIRSVQGDPDPGDIVTLRGESGVFLARGYWNPNSQIRVHVLTWNDGEAIDAAFWRSRLERAISAREVENAQHTQAQAQAQSVRNAYRLVNAENDGIPGLVVDRYANWLVIQALTLGIDQRKEEIARELMELLAPEGIYERSDVDVRSKEGLRMSSGVLAGEAPPPLIEIDENGCQFLVDVMQGHKTGFYLDQRLNRSALGEWVRNHGADQRILNCFCYTGGFSVYARGAGAEDVTSVDASADALALAAHNMQINGQVANGLVEGDVFDVLRKYRAAREQFDVIILDPPKFAQSQKQVEGACRGYKDINWLAFQLLRPGGLLMTFSCSGLVDADLFQKVVFGALIDARREAQIIARLTAGPDHPVALTFPEGMYLKGLMCRVW